MSYDISLTDPATGETIELEKPHLMTGGTYALGGTRQAWLNITYNYADWYYKDGVFAKTKEESKGIRTIYGLTGAESIPVLKTAIKALESCQKELSEEERQEYIAHNVTGYWLPERTNAIKPLYQLLSLAQMRPDGVWKGD